MKYLFKGLAMNVSVTIAIAISSFIHLCWPLYKHMTQMDLDTAEINKQTFNSLSP